MLRILALAVLMVGIFCFGPAAFADTGAIIDLKPLIEPLIGLLGVLLTILTTLAIRWVSKRLGVEDLARQEFVTKGIEQLLERATDFAAGRLRDASFTTITTKSEALAVALSYAVEKAPDLLNKAGLDPSTSAGRDKLIDMVEARLGLKIATAPAGE